MYAIIETGGKQYRVEKGDVIDIELVEPSKEKAVTFSNIVLFHNGKDAKIGIPYVNGCQVEAEILGEVKGDKVIAYKYTRGNYYRTKGHRQKYLQVKITEIKGK